MMAAIPAVWRPASTAALATRSRKARGTGRSRSSTASRATAVTMAAPAADCGVRPVPNSTASSTPKGSAKNGSSASTARPDGRSDAGIGASPARAAWRSTPIQQATKNRIAGSVAAITMSV